MNTLLDYLIRSQPNEFGSVGRTGPTAFCGILPSTDDLTAFEVLYNTLEYKP